MSIKRGLKMYTNYYEGLYYKGSKEYKYYDKLNDTAFLSCYNELQRQGYILIYKWLNDYFSITKIKKAV